MKKMMLSFLVLTQISFSAFAADAELVRYIKTVKKDSMSSITGKILSQGAIALSACSASTAVVTIQALIDTVPVASGTLAYAIPLMIAGNDAPMWDMSGDGGDECYKGGNGMLGIFTAGWDTLMLIDILDGDLDDGYNKKVFQGTRKLYKTTEFVKNRLFRESSACVQATAKVLILTSEIKNRL